jgi:hypothetical protein
MKSKLILMAALTAVLSMGLPSIAQTPASSPTSQNPKTTEKKATTATPAPTDQEISDAKAKGMVWVNTKTKVYHQADSRFYGKTKHGEFMTEDQATKDGYRAAKNEAASKSVKKSATQANK